MSRGININLGTTLTVIYSGQGTLIPLNMILMGYRLYNVCNNEGNVDVTNTMSDLPPNM